MTETKIIVLGTAYTVTCGTPQELPQLEREQAVGLTSFSKKAIQLDSRYNKADFARAYRHEVMHAFFHEAGLAHYANDEMLVDFIAAQYPKLQKLLDVRTISQKR